MTTIAYKDGVLAADTLITANGMICGYAKKIWRAGRLLIGGAGSDAVTNTFRDWVKDGMSGDHPLKKDIGNLFIVKPDGLTVMWCDDGPFLMKETFWALGSGEEVAMGAMAAGASARKAVQLACARDTRSGGDVTVLKLART